MFEYFIATYGYPALAIGAIVEGEVALVIAGFLSYLGYMYLPTVILVSFLGSLAGDQIYFYLGRKKGKKIIEKYPHLQDRMKWVHRKLERHSTMILLLFRFAFGFRAIIPISLGTSNVASKKFFIFNSVGAIIWSLIFTTIGYFYGSAVSSLLDDIKKYELLFVASIIFASIIFWFFVILKKRTVLNRIKGGIRSQSNIMM